MTQTLRDAGRSRHAIESRFRTVETHVFVYMKVSHLVSYGRIRRRRTENTSPRESGSRRMTLERDDPITFEFEDTADRGHESTTQRVEVALADGVKRRQSRTERGISGRLWTGRVPVVVGPPSDFSEHQEVAQQLEERERHGTGCPTATRWAV